MLSGHWHTTTIIRPGDRHDHNGAPCTVVVGGRPNQKEKLFTGAAVEIGSDGIQVWFTDQDHKVKWNGKI